MPDLWMELEATMRRFPHHTVLQAGSTSLTYHELYEQVQQMAERLRVAGISAGKLVALFFHHRPYCVITFLALTKLQARVILLNSETPPEDLRRLFHEIGEFPLLACPYSQEQLEQIAPMSPLSLVNLDALLFLPSREPLSRDEILSTSSSQAEQGFVAHYSSGSLGRPRLVMHSQQNLAHGGKLYQAAYHVTAQDTFLIAVPLSHSFGLVAGLVTALLTGARVLLIEQFVPFQVLALLKQEQVSCLIGTPLIYELLLSLNEQGIGENHALRVVLSSGSPVPLTVNDRFARCFGLPIFEVYGSTEMGVITAQWPRAVAWPRQSVGQPLPGVRIRLVDEAGHEMPRGATGQLLVQTPTMFLGYFPADDDRPSVFCDGWYQTGDLARQNSAGDLFLVGRHALLIPVYQQQVNPLVVETVLLSHPRVHEALVYADEVLCAAVVADGGEEALVDQLFALCRERLASFQVPARITLVSELPRGELGKLRRILSGIRAV